VRTITSSLIFALVSIDSLCMKTNLYKSVSPCVRVVRKAPCRTRTIVFHNTSHAEKPRRKIQRHSGDTLSIHVPSHVPKDTIEIYQLAFTAKPFTPVSQKRPTNRIVKPAGRCIGSCTVPHFLLLSPTQMQAISITMSFTAMQTPHKQITYKGLQISMFASGKAFRDSGEILK
jgi:hypothetical protein